MKRFICVAAVAALTGCSAIGTGSNISVALHSDIQAAAAYAEANGYPERAQVRRAIDAQLTACEKAIDAAKPKAPTGQIGPILLSEMLEEAAGAGVPAAVKVNCAPLPLIGFPRLP